MKAVRSPEIHLAQIYEQRMRLKAEGLNQVQKDIPGGSVLWDISWNGAPCAQSTEKVLEKDAGERGIREGATKGFYVALGP